MRLFRQTLLLSLTTGLVMPGYGLTQAVSLAECERQFITHPDDHESARCFWLLARRTGHGQEIARRVRALLARYPGNPGLELSSALLEPSLPERAELLMRSAAGGFFNHDVEG